VSALSKLREGPVSCDFNESSQEVFGRNKETIKSWVKAEPSSHIWVARLPPSLDAGAHAIDVLAVDEYGRSHQPAGFGTTG
jgi:hypothetical protein